MLYCPADPGNPSCERNILQLLPDLLGLQGLLLMVVWGGKGVHRSNQNLIGLAGRTGKLSLFVHLSLQGQFVPLLGIDSV